MHETRIREIYERVARDVAGLEGPARTATLKRLRPALHDLRSAYRNDNVCINYTPDAVAAYMLAYYPHHVFMTYQTMRDVPLAHGSSLNVITFGGGPLPELVGLVCALDEARRLPDGLRVRTFDVSRSWRFGTSHALARQMASATKIYIHQSELDFTHFIPHPLRAFLGKADLVILQNCCNEMVASENYHDNIMVLLEALSAGATLVLADQSDYNSTANAIADIEATIMQTGRYKAIRTFKASRKRWRSPFIDVPSDVSKHFFDDKELLRPRRNIAFASAIFSRI